MFHCHVPWPGYYFIQHSKNPAVAQAALPPQHSMMPAKPKNGLALNSFAIPGAVWWSSESKREAVLVRKPPPSSPTSPEPKHVTLQHLCAMPLPPPSSPDGQLSSPTQHSRHLQPASFSKIQPTITISMAIPHPSVTSSHNSHQTPHTPAASPRHPP